MEGAGARRGWAGSSPRSRRAGIIETSPCASAPLRSPAHLTVCEMKTFWISPAFNGTLVRHVSLAIGLRSRRVGFDLSMPEFPSLTFRQQARVETTHGDTGR